MPDRIAVIGGRDYILGFKALGVSVFPAETGEEASQALAAIRDGGYAAVFISEDFAEELKDILEELREKPLPAVALIPGARGSRGLALERLRQNARRAIGADIL